MPGPAEKQQISFKTPAENTKYTRHQNLEVADVPNHIVRTFEVQRVYPANPPIIGGLKLVEQWGRGACDYIDGNGNAYVYDEYVMENGDRFFARYVFVTERTPEGVHYVQVGNIIKGTGKLAGMQGIARVVGDFNMKTGYNQIETKIEYAIGK